LTGSVIERHLSLVFICVFCVAVPSAGAQRTRQKDWWRGSGAAVVEHRYAQGEVACSLFLYNKDQAVVVTWSDVKVKEISFYDKDWSLQPNQQVAVAVQIGDTWLGNPVDEGPPTLMASTNGERVHVPIEQPLEDLVRRATRIGIKMADRAMYLEVGRRKMSALLRAVERCRAMLEYR
jgi:hypothetical protein